MRLVRKLNSIVKVIMNKTFITLLSGIAIGLLIAPARGTETLNRVADKLNDIRDRFRDRADDMFIAGDEMVHNENVETVS